MGEGSLQKALRLVRSGRAQEAIPMLLDAVQHLSGASMAHALLIEAWTASGDRQQALLSLKSSIELPITGADVADALGFYARQLDQHEASNQCYRKAVALAPNEAELWYNFATSERALGRLAEAAEACRRALHLAPDYRPAILLRSEVTKASDTHNHVDDLKQRIAKSGHAADAMFFQYALGKELHDLGSYDEAFAAFAAGARLRRANLNYDVAVDERKLARIAEVFDQPAVAPAGQGRHLFIVGLPRSGTTLTERILGALENVRSNNETDNFSNALLRSAPPGGDVFARCAAADPQRVADAYERLAVIDGFEGAVIEKLPFNYLYIGAIWRAFPGTPVIWVRRNPIDNCFAMFRTLFGAAYPFSYDFSDLARYFAAYLNLMNHWTQLSPEGMVQVDYESLVDNPELIGEQLARNCGLTWDRGALQLDRNSSASLTASAAQVRGSIYKSSNGIWKSYERHLAPLIDNLAALGVELA